MEHGALDDMSYDSAVAQFFLEEVSNVLDDSVRINAVKHSHLICREIGAERVLVSIERHLLPLEVSDAVLLALAVSLGEREFGGSARALATLTWLLESPDVSVRRAAVKSVLQHAHRGQPLERAAVVNVSAFDPCPADPEESKAQEPLAHVRMGADGEEALLLPWLSDVARFKSFYQRLSVCELLGSGVPSGLTAAQEADLVLRLARDQVPQVRMSLADSLGRLAPPPAPAAGQAEPWEARRLISLPIMRELMLDPDDIVQATAVASCLVQFVARVAHEERVPFIREELVHSPSWRARLALARQMDRVLEAVLAAPTGPPLSSLGPPLQAPSGSSGSSAEDMDVDGEQGSDNASEPPPPPLPLHSPAPLLTSPPLPQQQRVTSAEEALAELRLALAELLTDPEPEVRAEAVKHLQHFVESNESCATLLQRVGEDEDEQVRKAALAPLHILARRFPQPAACLLDKLIAADQEATVRIAAVESLFFKGVIAELEPAERLELVRNVYQSSASTDAIGWRIKSLAASAVAVAAAALPREQWTEHAQGLAFLKRCLCDHVFTVRKTAVGQLAPLAQAYGKDWAKTHLCPVPDALYRHESDYKVRTTVLEVLSELFKLDCFTETNAQVVRLAANDPVPNVRNKAAALFPNL
jgi:HEAT repeat protein